MTPSTAPDEVASLLAEGHLDHGPAYRVAWQWNRAGNPGELAKAERLLAGLTAPDMFPYALELWYERAFNLVQQQRHEDALGLLDQLGRDFQHTLDEDTFSLWGRVYKDRGHAALDSGEVIVAERAYAESEALYLKGYQIRNDRFPGINVASLRYFRASLMREIARRFTFGGNGASRVEPRKPDRDESAELLVSARVLATELVADHSGWRDRLPDDPIWRPATLGEAHFLLGDWSAAESAYRRAFSDTRVRPEPFHPATIATQLCRLTAAAAGLGLAPPQPFDDPTGFIYGLTPFPHRPSREGERASPPGFGHSP